MYHTLSDCSGGGWVNGAGDQTPTGQPRGHIKTQGSSLGDRGGEGRGWVSTSTTVAAGPTKAYRSPPSRESQQLGKKRQAVSTQSAPCPLGNQCARKKYIN